MNLRRLCVSLAIGAAATVCFAQPNRILSKIDNARTVTLPGRVHPLATAGNDAGAVDPSFPVPFITLLLKPAAAQQASLDQLLQDQQNPASSSYHRWLTPEQYADRFGISPGDAAQIVAWLQSQGFKVNPVSRSRTFITFDGAAGQVQAAFGTAIHHYQAEGRLHYANATDPKVPAALSSVVAGFRGLTDFHFKPRLVKAKPLWTPRPRRARPGARRFRHHLRRHADVFSRHQRQRGENRDPGAKPLYNSARILTSFLEYVRSHVGQLGADAGPTSRESRAFAQSATWMNPASTPNGPAQWLAMPPSSSSIRTTSWYFRPVCRG